MIYLNCMNIIPNFKKSKMDNKMKKIDVNELFSTLPNNTIVIKDKDYTNEILNSLIISIKNDKLICICKVVFDFFPSMVLSEWIHSQYLNKCKEQGFNPNEFVFIYRDNIFQPLQQFSFINYTTSVLVGEGEEGNMLMLEILKAKSSFDKNKFDEDGYIK